MNSITILLILAITIKVNGIFGNSKWLTYGSIKNIDYSKIFDIKGGGKNLDLSNNSKHYCYITMLLLYYCAILAKKVRKEKGKKKIEGDEKSLFDEEVVKEVKETELEVTN
jgi:uncharacterized membrane protein